MNLGPCMCVVHGITAQHDFTEHYLLFIDAIPDTVMDYE